METTIGYGTLLNEMDSFAPTIQRSNYAVAVCGGSGTGKSYVSEAIRKGATDRVTVLGLDRYQLGSDFEGLANSPYGYDDPRNFQLERVAQDLAALRGGQAVSVPQFTLRAMRSTAEVQFRPGPILVVDGLYAALDGLRQQVDHSVYIEEPFYARFLRRLFRLTLQDGIPNPQVAVKHMFGPTLLAHRAFVRSQRDTADVVLSQRGYSFRGTVAQFGLRPISGESASDVLWQNDDGLSIALDTKKARNIMSVIWGGDLYAQFGLQTPQAKLVRKTTDFEEL